MRPVLPEPLMSPPSNQADVGAALEALGQPGGIGVEIFMRLSAVLAALGNCPSHVGADLA